ncbi:zinc finger protein 184-like isoform X1 [Branchiostoma floridae]|uniref:Zinc finger protein 184-like isoform X1 n=1 Tax=Branchiostoma floridae TaxID=7739 RepID=A0A9J7NCT5_BRAFL|nr:zinc finger protein 184-like isoform X1 [Branchiostoma floridae]
MTRQQEFICGLSQEVTIAVLPRLNMEELMFELNRRIQNLDKESSIKDRLVSILRDVMLEEYRQWERKAEISMPGKDQETIIIQRDTSISTAYAEMMSTETSTPDASQQSSGPDLVNSKENNDTSNEVFTHTKELSLNAVQAQLTATIPPSNTTLTQMNTTVECIKREDDALATEDGAGRGYHDELNMDTLTFSTQVLDGVNSTSNTYTKKPVQDDKPCQEVAVASAFCEPTSDHTEIHTCIKTECLVPEDDTSSLPSNWNQNECCTDDREIGLINGEHKKCQTVNIEETLPASCKPTPHRACKNMAPLLSNKNSEEMCDVRRRKTSNAQKISNHRQCFKAEEKPFMCGECGYRASNKTRLVEHMRTHTGEKLFKCNQCHYQASLKSSLVKHMKKHSDEEPYCCDLCEYKTYDWSHIKRHMKYHAGVKPYKCEECDYSAVDKSDLTKHRRRHTGERPYSCQECNYKATEKGSLVRHMRTRHQCK